MLHKYASLRGTTMSRFHYRTKYLFWLGLYHWAGKRKNALYRQAKAEWQRNSLNKCWLCAICGKKIPKRQSTIDHIIPKNILYEFDLDPMVWDKRNFQAAHQLCNVRRGLLTVDDMPDSIKEKLFALISTRTNTPSLDKEKRPREGALL